MLCSLANLNELLGSKYYIIKLSLVLLNQKPKVEDLNW